MGLRDLLFLESRLRLADGDGAGALESARVAALWVEKFAGQKSNLLLETVNILQHSGKNDQINRQILLSVGA